MQSKNGRKTQRPLTALVLAGITAAVLAWGLGTRTAQAEDWDMYLTVDNEFDVYFGTSTMTDFHAGGGNDWETEYHFAALGRAPTDYMYVSTASDHSSAQGFIGTFTNTTTNATTNTGDVVWEVFPAGAYAATNPYWPNPWPASTMPTQAQVDTAIAYAEANTLWGAPTTVAGYDNDPSTPIAPYTWIWPVSLPNVPLSAEWIWYDTGLDPGMPNIPAPFRGFNHDEFLVFRVAGAAPEPGTLVLLGLGGLALLHRRRA